MKDATFRLKTKTYKADNEGQIQATRELEDPVREEELHNRGD